MDRRLNEGEYATDKGKNKYLARYEQYFCQLADQKIHLLELGVYKGESLLMWRDYFSQATIVGLDIERVSLSDSTGRIHVYQGLQQDKVLLDRIRKETAENGFDIIIDDASHLGDLTKVSFWHLFDNHLKAGGIYVIEDWRTGYWDRWPDGKPYVFRRDKSSNAINYIDLLLSKKAGRRPAGGQGSIAEKALRKIRRALSNKIFKSHEYGMVGFIKQLVDELGMDMITCPERGGAVPRRDSKFMKMEIFPGQVFIVKNSDGALKAV